MSSNIITCKYKADAIEYFNLFDKYIPANLKRKDIYLREISNVDVLYNIIKKNPSNNYFINDAEDVFSILKIRCRIDFPKINLIFYNSEKLDMKFDLIIMNPPYQKNLHLKILEEAIKHLKDDDSVCVNLSPCEWLIDTLNEIKKTSLFNKYKNGILKYLKQFDIIDANKANELFKIGLMTDLGIYTCQRNCQSFDASQIKWYKSNKNLFNKLIYTDKPQFPKIIKYDESQHNFFVPLKLIANPYRSTAFNICTSTFKWLVNGNMPDGRNWTNGVYKSKSMNADKQLYGISFLDENHAKNFYNSTYTKCFKYANKLVKRFNQNVNTTYLPWLGDAINPRTGLKGYEGEWTDEDLYTFFNITSEEQKIIEETMEKYK